MLKAWKVLGIIFIVSGMLFLASLLIVGDKYTKNPSEDYEYRGYFRYNGEQRFVLLDLDANQYTVWCEEDKDPGEVTIIVRNKVIFHDRSSRGDKATASFDGVKYEEIGTFENHYPGSNQYYFRVQYSGIFYIVEPAITTKSTIACCGISFAIVGVVMIVILSKKKEKMSYVTRDPHPQPPPTTIPKVQFPVVGFCPECESELRVHKPERFRCPHCEGIADIDEYGRIHKIPDERVEPGATQKVTDPEIDDPHTPDQDQPPPSPEDTPSPFVPPPLPPREYSTELNGNWLCPRCSTELDEGSIHCPICGCRREGE